jgi:CheY-like chemotaxis protein
MSALQNASQNAPRIMIVEDEALVALMVEDLLTDLGCQISGSFGAVDEALAYLKDAAAPPPALDGAVLDVNIGGTMVFPVAERLRAAGIPFVFATGYGALPRQGFEDVTVLNKPINPGLLEDAVKGFCTAA